MADYIEPNRDFEGLKELRKLAFEDLDAAMLMGLEMSIDDMSIRGIKAHSNSQKAVAWFSKLKYNNLKG
jgi:nicotinate-nucleotide adenylyltransferase